MTDIIIPIIMTILFIIFISVLNDIFSILLYMILVIVVATNINTFFTDIPVNTINGFYMIYGILILVCVHRATHVFGKTQQKIGEIWKDE
jgi:hypothetical protein